MKSKKQMQTAILALKQQAGMTLMEIIAALAIIAAVVVGALALFNSAQSSNLSVSMLKDLTALRSATQQLYQGQGTYGTGGTNLNTALVNGKKVPNDLVTNATVTPATITAPWPGGAVTVLATANPTQFGITFTNLPQDVCIQLVSNSSTGWYSVTRAAAANVTTQTTFPVSPAVASTTYCTTAGATNTISWASQN